MMEHNWLTIDFLHGLVWLTGLKTLSVLPSPLLPNDGIPSCIDGLDDHACWSKQVRLEGWQRLFYPLTCGLRKLYLNFFLKYVALRFWAADSLIRKRGQPAG